ncbi:carbohydrate ABC transporter permease [Vallitalea guaymasensis]|uniref:Sugar ABC transporter permease n=1 Tax=Vallitalea guaymasensis TaxID=1185412 RepID=A0A8J8M7U0_9FIRM|nr:sugar ABC transporter permease [Vallitalea guaymasensis]QUH27869.1 sugar ABC transporter permease [Vallitalea guaymasensis]
MKSKAVKENKKSYKRIRVKYKNEIIAYRMLAIPLILWGIFFLFALFRVIYLSFTDWNIFKAPDFVGLDNYIRIFTNDGGLWKAFNNTFIWTIFTVIGHNLIGLGTAYMITCISKGEKFFRAALFWPILVSQVVGATMIEWIFDPSPYGFLNTILGHFGIKSVAWLSDPDMALISLMLYPLFLGFGIRMLIYLAGLKQIPKTFYEAAKIDGASNWTIFKKVTIPLLKPIILLNIVYTTIESFKVIGPMQLVTKGGPIGSTMSVVLRIYQDGFVENKMGYASSIAVMFFIFILIVTIIQFRFEGEKVTYE